MTLVPLRRRPNSTPCLVDPGDDDSETLATSGHHEEDGDIDINRTDLGNLGANDDDNDEGPITGKTYTQQQYWNYVDDYLEYIRTELFANITDRSARNAKMMQCVRTAVLHPFQSTNHSLRLFNEALQIDMFNYRGGGKKPPPPSGQLLTWQQVLHRSSCW